MELQAKTSELDAQFTVRPCTMDDLQAVVDLFNTVDRPYHDADIHDIVDFKMGWEIENFNLETSTRAIFNGDGEMIAYGEVYDVRAIPVRPSVWLRVHPNYDVEQIGTWLLHWSEERARQVFDRVPDDARVMLEVDVLREKDAMKRLLEDFGLTTDRGFYTMLIEMDEAPALPQTPDNLRMTTHAEEPDITLREIYRAIKDSFQDHRGHVEEPFEEGFARFEAYAKKDQKITPATTILAMDGDKIAGISACRLESWDAPDRGHVNTLGVMREYRRKGLGDALLRHSFKMFWDMGQKKVDLGVDASSLTNAVGLYERAGMHIDKVYDAYEKELRPGKEYSKQ